VNISAPQTGSPRGGEEDRLARESAAGLGNGPLPQPSALPISISKSRRGRRGMRLICFKDDL